VSVLDRILAALARITDPLLVWHRWPFPVSVAIVVGHRVNMRRNNLTDTETAPLTMDAPADGDVMAARSADGSYNDLASPRMGMAGMRFGRNIPLAEAYGEKPPTLYQPSPRLISERLLARREFVPVPHLNVLAGAWIQFMVHDWLSHGPNSPDDPHEVPLPAGDDWPGGRMTVLRTQPDARVSDADAGRPSAYRNTETSWWDASQVYGSSLQRQIAVRTDPATGKVLDSGKLWLGSQGFLPADPSAKIGGIELAGVNGNWWLGLSILHTLFAREHNAVVDRLKIDHPEATGEWLFQKARLVVAALLAKIHTVEWTPALMNSPDGRMIMRGNFWGALGEHYWRAHGRVGTGEIVSGIPGSPQEHHGAPYAMTEEFAAVYRLHSLMPDSISFRDHSNDKAIEEIGLPSLTAAQPPKIYQRTGFDNAVYSLATSNPGALVLHNYPNSLRRLNKKADEGLFVDLATIDILRDRERGVPRYCEFRRLVGASVPKSFAELTDDVAWQKELRDIYGTIDKVDLLVGTLAESRSKNGTPLGFGFSDTAFRVFILMASRRLKSDRFFTDDYRPEVYTPAGFAWVADNSLRTVIERHCPSLAPAFGNVRNVFFPWARAAE
jgi:hypothetical protein